VLEQLAANAFISGSGSYIGMPDQGDIRFVLDTHDPNDMSIL
jgi:hypothetical protein